MIAAACARGRRRSFQNLGLRNRLDEYLLIERIHRGSIKVLRQVSYTLFQVFVSLIEEILLSSALSIITGRYQQRVIIFNVSESIKYFNELLSPFFLLLLLPRLYEISLRVAHQGSAGSS